MMHSKASLVRAMRILELLDMPINHITRQPFVQVSTIQPWELALCCT